MKINIIKKIFKNIGKVNREFLLLFGVIAALGVVVYSSTAVSQTGEDITITTFHPAPFGQFNEVTARIFSGYNDPTFFIDPSGISRIKNLQVVGGIITDHVSGTAGAGGYNFDVVIGDATLNEVTATRFYQEDLGPEGPVPVDGTEAATVRGVGKYIYGINDIAEGVIADGCEAGDVVLISDDDKADVMKSSISFDSRVAGVISTDPKIYMGSAKHKVPLALAGIVKCKATAENGSILRGDLLVTSSLAGHAMKAVPKEVKPGMIIGKAMQPLKENTGTIYILVNKK